ALSAPGSSVATWAPRVARAGLLVFAAFLPISIAGMQVGLGASLIALVAARLGGRRTWARSPLDLPVIALCGAALASLAFAAAALGRRRCRAPWLPFLAPMAAPLAPRRLGARRDRGGAHPLAGGLGGAVPGRALGGAPRRPPDRGARGAGGGPGGARGRAGVS